MTLILSKVWQHYAWLKVLKVTCGSCTRTALSSTFQPTVHCTPLATFVVMQPSLILLPSNDLKIKNVATNMRRILVTGGSGLVGHGLQSVASSYPDIELVCVSSKDADLRDPSAVHALLSKHAPLDGIIHCAANVGGLFKNMKYPVEMLEDNLIMNTNILREAHAQNINNVVCILSTCIFPDAIAASGTEMTPTHLHEGPPHPSNEGYAYAKRMMEVQCRAYQRQYDRRYFCVVPTNIYGPHDNFHLENAHVVPALIHKAYIAKQQNAEFVVAGDGTPLRQFIYVDDLAHLILKSYLNYEDLQTPRMLCPPNAETTIGEVAKIIVESFGIQDRMRFDTTKANGQARKTVIPCDETDMQYTPLVTGLRKAIAWFIENGTSIAK